MRARDLAAQVRFRSNARRRGFSLAESLIASTVLAIAVAAVSVSTTAAFQNDKYVEETNTAVLLGRELMEQIAATAFENLDDFSNYTDTSVAIRTSDAGNAGTTNTTASLVYTRNVTLTYRATYDGAETTSGPIATVKVVVAAPSGRSITLTRLLTELPLELPG